MKSTRKGLGRGLGTGYKNIVPMDSHIHSLSAKGQKSYWSAYHKPKTVNAMGYMHQFKIDNEYSVVAYSEDTRNGFRHIAKLMKNGSEVDSAKVSYLNRTWEKYPFDTVSEKLLRQHFDEKKADEMLKKYNERRNLNAKGTKLNATGIKRSNNPRNQYIKDDLDELEDEVYSVDEVRKLYKFEDMSFDYLGSQATSLAKEVSGQNPAFDIGYIKEKINKVTDHLTIIERAKERSKFAQKGKDYDKYVAKQWKKAEEYVKKNPSPTYSIKVVKVK